MSIFCFLKKCPDIRSVQKNTTLFLAYYMIYFFYYKRGGKKYGMDKRTKPSNIRKGFKYIGCCCCTEVVKQRFWLSVLFTK